MNHPDIEAKGRNGRSKQKCSLISHTVAVKQSHADKIMQVQFEEHDTVLLAMSPLPGAAKPIYKMELYLNSSIPLVFFFSDERANSSIIHTLECLVFIQV